MAGKPAKADKAEANEANKAETNEADGAANEANVAKKANVIEIVAAKKAIVFNEVIAVDEADTDEADRADISNELPFTLTKCFEAFFSKDNAYFGIHVDVCNNKLLMARSRDELDKLVEVEGANNNQLRDCLS